LYGGCKQLSAEAESILRMPSEKAQKKNPWNYTALKLPLKSDWIVCVRIERISVERSKMSENEYCHDLEYERRFIEEVQVWRDIDLGLRHLKDFYLEEPCNSEKIGKPEIIERPCQTWGES